MKGVRATTKQEAVNRLVDLARAEVGTREGSNNWNKYAEEPGITKLYGWKPQNQPWCCTFVNWVFLTAFGYDLGSRLTYGGTAACANSAQLFKAAGAFVYFPQVGDQAFYYSGGGINHTGIVVKVEGSVFAAVEGNYSDKVSLVQHNIGQSDVAGFGRPKWELVDGVKEAPKQTAPQTPTTQTPKQEPKEDHSWRPRLLSYSNAYKDDCVVLQALLNAHKFACGSADGFFGAKTQAAVSKAQRYYGLETDGICGPKTWAKLLERSD